MEHESVAVFELDLRGRSSDEVEQMRENALRIIASAVVGPEHLVSEESAVLPPG